MNARLDRLASDIVATAAGIHRKHGTGLLESTYEACLVLELIRRGFHVDRLPACHRGKNDGDRPRLLVEEDVAVTLKTAGRDSPAQEARFRSHLERAHCRVGLLIDFRARRIGDGVRRVSLPRPTPF